MTECLKHIRTISDAAQEAGARPSRSGRRRELVVERGIGRATGGGRGGHLFSIVIDVFLLVGGRWKDDWGEGERPKRVAEVCTGCARDESGGCEIVSKGACRVVAKHDV